MILAACRSWAMEINRTGVDPSSLRETGRMGFQGTLLPHLEVIAPCHTEYPAGLADWDPGKVDLVLELRGREDWLELKWCRHRETFGNCLWDAAKVAAGVRQGRARHGYMLVGAPVALWEGRLPATARVSGVSAHPGSSLVNDYPAWWRHWCRENQRTYPRRLPTPVLTAPVGRVRHFGPTEAPWELRLIRAEAPGEETYEAPCP